MDLKSVLAFICVVAVAPAAAAEPADPLCEYLLEARRVAESEGRLDFDLVIEADGSGDLTPRVHMGSPYAVGRINFTGHATINDSTLRRAMMLRERDLFDVGKLRRSLARINE